MSGLAMTPVPLISLKYYLPKSRENGLGPKTALTRITVDGASSILFSSDHRRFCPDRL